MRLKSNVLAACVFAALSVFADITVSDVKVFSGHPWKEVVVGYTITGSVDVPTFICMSVTDEVAKKTYAAITLTGAETTEGRHVLRWNPAADGVCISSPKVSFSIMITDRAYVVIDLSGGASAMSYPVLELDEDAPVNGWSDEYKTTRIVLRRIEAGTFKMQNTYDVTLTKPFYIGVFEVTQGQWQRVMGTNPSDCKGGTRPVERVSYDMIRGNLDGAKWPTTDLVDASSFLGKLRARTGLDFDLPTEAQWEYACRAGTTSDYNNGGSTESDLRQLGRYEDNYSDGKGYILNVGSYLPNAWGLYDMHGNVCEWCLDWDGKVGSSTDPKGADSGRCRVVRGGNWYSYARSCTSSSRAGLVPSSYCEDRMARGYIQSCGFRLSWTPQKWFK